MKRLFLGISVFWLIAGVPGPLYAADAGDPNLNHSEVSVSAQSAALIDVESGRILYEKNGNQPMRIASLTKIITAIVAIESGHLNDTVTVSPRAAGKEGSSIYLKAGEKQKLIDLIYAIMLRSGNDAATAIAEHVGGSVAGFAERMNFKMRWLGLSDSHFVNPHGLDAPEHYSTAHDMAVVTADALRNPIFAEIVKTQVKTIPWPGESWSRRMKNKNKMLSRYPGADGVKTGYTKRAGRCLAASATRDGRQLAVIVLNAPDDWNDCAKLLDYGFSVYMRTHIVVRGQTVVDARLDRVRRSETLHAGDDFFYPLRAGEQPVVRPILPEGAGQIRQSGTVGRLAIYLHGKEIGHVPLVLQRS
jgi:D-alanyl-D-alanine carboxypeptidase (penicillin-binding protein 5/6)